MQHRLHIVWIIFTLLWWPVSLWGSDTDSCRYLRQITIEGKRKTKDEIILRELNFRQGDCLSDQELRSLEETTRSRLYNLKLFNEVSVNLDTVAAGDVVVRISLIDRFPVFPEGNIEFADRNFNVWWTEQHRDWRRINLGLTLSHNNIRGNREVVSVTGQLGYTPKIGISYSRPYADRRQRWGYGFSVFGLQNREIAYRTERNKLLFYRSDDRYMQRRADVALWVTYRPKYAITHTFETNFQHYWISRTILGFNSNYLGKNQTEENVLHFRYRLEYNGVDNWNYPLVGSRFIAYFDQNFLLNAGRFQSKVHLQYDHYWNPVTNWYASLVFRGSIGFPAAQPYIFSRNLGYEFDYIRGFEYYVMDGSAFSLLRLDAKRMLLDKKIRLPLRYFEVIPIKILAKVYTDGGFGVNHRSDGDFLGNRFLYSGGIGVDIITLYDIKLRIEYTFNSLGEKGLFLHKNGT